MTASLARRVGAACHLSGSFRLRSGQVSTEYFDKYRFEADPVLLREVAEAMVALLPDCDVLAGMELGGIPIATVMAQLTGLPTAFVRKAAKPYGTERTVEGAEVRGRRVVVVEDVVTTAGRCSPRARRCGPRTRCSRRWCVRSTASRVVRPTCWRPA